MARNLDRLRLSSISLVTCSRKGENSDYELVIIIISVDSKKSIIIIHMLVKTI